MKKIHMLLFSIVITIFGYYLIFSSDWKMALGITLLLWSENIVRQQDDR